MLTVNSDTGSSPEAELLQSFNQEQPENVFVDGIQELENDDEDSESQEGDCFSPTSGKIHSIKETPMDTLSNKNGPELKLTDPISNTSQSTLS